MERAAHLYLHSKPTNCFAVHWKTTRCVVTLHVCKYLLLTFIKTKMKHGLICNHTLIKHIHTRTQGQYVRKFSVLIRVPLFFAQPKL